MSSSTETSTSTETNDTRVDATQDSNVLIAVTTVISFITLAITGIFLFLKITRWLRLRGEHRIDRSRKARIKKAYKKRSNAPKVRNAFEDDEWEGVPS